jgi:hypothetical protein
MRVLLLALLTAVLCGTTTAAPRGPTIYPILERDKRLDKAITLDRPPETLGRLLLHVSKQTGVEIACAGDFLGQTVLFQVKDTDAREVMTQIGILAKGHWLRRKGTYLLIQNGDFDRFIEAGGSVGKQIDAARRLWHGLTPAQRQQLAAGRPLPITQLAASQRYWFTVAFDQEYFMRPQDYNRTIFNEHPNAEIRLLPGRPPNNQPQFSLWMPTVSEQGITGPEHFLMVDLSVVSR